MSGPEVVRIPEARLEAPAEAMEVYTVSRAGEPLGTIGIPTRDHLNAATVASIISSDLRWAIELGRPIEFVILQGNVLTWQRNEIINRMRGDWVLFIDDDMTWPPDAISRIVRTREEHDFDILGGLCFRRAHPFQPTMYMREQADRGHYNFLESWSEGEIVEVDATGMAFCLVHKRVFEMMIEGPMPPFGVRMAMGGPPPNFFRWEGSYGEDLRFCQEAKAAGARIHVDTSIVIGHRAEVSIGPRDFLRAVAERTPAVQSARQRKNDQMGLPTMTPTEARERLGW